MDWEEVYAIGRSITWWIVFVIAYIYAIATGGFILGLGLGWLPAAIIATIAAFLWPVLAILLILGILLIIGAIVASSGK